MKINYIKFYFTAIIFILSGCNVFLDSDNNNAYISITTGIDISKNVTPSNRSTIDDIISFKLSISGDDMTTLIYEFTEQTINLEVEAGNSRTFSLEAIDNNDNTIFSGNSTVDLTSGEETTVNIVLEPKGYYVYFDTSGGDTLSPTFLDPDSIITIDEIPEKDGYKLLGWYKDSEFTQEWTLESDIVTEDMTLYALWEVLDPILYTVTFDTEEEFNINDLSISENTLIENSLLTDYKDYFINGYYKDSCFLEQWDFNTDTVTEDTTLYVEWANNYYLEGSSGSKNYVTADSVCSTLGSTTELTIELWINPSDVSTDMYIVAFNGNDIGNKFQFGIVSNELKIYNGTEGSQVTGASVNIDNWYHVAFTVDSSGNVDVYLNGVDQNYTGVYSDGSGTIFDSEGFFSIGQEWDDSSDSNHFNGSVYDIRVWSDIRTAAEIQDNMNIELTGSEEGLVAYYKCSDATDELLPDSSGNNNNGTIVP